MITGRKPRQFVPLLCKGEKFGDEEFCLTYSRERGFFEPITNRDSEPMIGKITAWRYRGAE